MPFPRPPRDRSRSLDQDRAEVQAAIRRPAERPQIEQPVLGIGQGPGRRSRRRPAPGPAPTPRWPSPGRGGADARGPAPDPTTRRGPRHAPGAPSTRDALVPRPACRARSPELRRTIRRAPGSAFARWPRPAERHGPSQAFRGPAARVAHEPRHEIEVHESAHGR